MSTASLFTPTQISGCQLWLDSSTTFAGFSNGQTISSWTDKSTNAFSGTAVNSPTVQTNGINGLPVVQFNGTNQYFDFGNRVNLGTSQIFVFAVCKFNSSADGSIIAKSSYRGNAGRWFLIRVAGDGGTEMGADATGAGVVAPFTDTSTSIQLLTGVWDRSNVIIFQNGTQQNSAPLANSTNLSNTDPLYIGAYPNGTGTGPQTGFYLNGIIGEILVYLNSFTTTQRQQIEGYLAWKWGLQGSLPSTHPYRLSPLYQLPPFPLVPRVPNTTGSLIVDPRSISGCALWLDAADTTTLSLSGTTVTQWRDKSASALIFTAPSDSQQPTFTKTGPFSSSVYFTTTQTMNSSTSLSLPPAQSIFFVFNSVSSSGFFFLEHSSDTNTIDGSYFYGGNGTFYQIRRSNWYGFTDGSVNSIVFSQNTSYFLSMVNSNTGSTLYNRNGTTRALTLYGTFTTLSGNATAPFYINSRVPVNCYHSEILVYSRALSSSEVQQIEGYLAWKWGLVSSLPSSHPYKVPIAPFPYAVRQTTIRSFRPTQFSGCQLWLDAADNSQMTFSGSVVTSIKDKAQSLTLTPQGSATTNLTLVQNSINDRQSLYFNNLANYNVWLQGTLSVFTTGSSFVVWQTLNQKVMPQWSPFFTWYQKTGSTNSQNPAFGYLGGETNLTVGPYTSFASPNGTPKTVTVNGTNYFAFYSWSGTTTSVSFNGATPTAGTQPSFTGTATTFLIGQDGDITGPADFWAATNMYLGEVVLYNVTLTQSQRQQVEGYLAWKWKLQANLPATHPYKFFPPPPQ